MVPTVAQGVNLGLGGFWESLRRETRGHSSCTRYPRAIWRQEICKELGREDKEAGAIGSLALRDKRPQGRRQRKKCGGG